MNGPENKWWDSAWFVLVMLLLLGPIGFIFLWPSKRFSLFWKILLSVFVIYVIYWSINFGAKVSGKLFEQLNILKK